jgi:hypothetical protein
MRGGSLSREWVHPLRGCVDRDAVRTGWCRPIFKGRSEGAGARGSLYLSVLRVLLVRTLAPAREERFIVDGGIALFTALAAHEVLGVRVDGVHQPHQLQVVL